MDVLVCLLHSVYQTAEYSGSGLPSCRLLDRVCQHCMCPNKSQLGYESMAVRMENKVMSPERCEGCPHELSMAAP